MLTCLTNQSCHVLTILKDGSTESMSPMSISLPGIESIEAWVHLIFPLGIFSNLSSWLGSIFDCKLPPCIWCKSGLGHWKACSMEHLMSFSINLLCATLSACFWASSALSCSLSFMISSCNTKVWVPHDYSTFWALWLRFPMHFPALEAEATLSDQPFLVSASHCKWDWWCTCCMTVS